jgi:XTP/dITP diphosphohydrolase
MKRRILLASTNPGKLTELSTMIGIGSNTLEWVCLADYPGIPEIEEDGTSFAENARKKALGYANLTGLWTLADDSGLVIDALDGGPGIYSARYAANECPSQNRDDLDIANYRKVLTNLKNVPDPDRTARFVCALCLASPDTILLETEGAVEGVINHSPAGDNGFGYDPIFYIPSLEKTAAQLTHKEKNLISHRGHAIETLKPLLGELLHPT